MARPGDRRGDDVVVIGIAHGTGASGVEVQWRQGYGSTVRDGMAIRFQWFNTWPTRWRQPDLATP